MTSWNAHAADFCMFFLNYFNYTFFFFKCSATFMARGIVKLVSRKSALRNFPPFFILEWSFAFYERQLKLRTDGRLTSRTVPDISRSRGRGGIIIEMLNNGRFTTDISRGKFRWFAKSSHHARFGANSKIYQYLSLLFYYSLLYYYIHLEITFATYTSLNRYAEK